MSKGLIEDSNEAINCLEEAYNIYTDSNMFRNFFCQYLLNCNPDIGTLWEHFKEKLSEDILHTQRITQNDQNLQFNNDIFHLCIMKLQVILEADGSSVSYFPDLPQLNNQQIQLLKNRYENQINPINENMRNEALAIFNLNYSKFNPQQKICFDNIVETAQNTRNILIF